VRWFHDQDEMIPEVLGAIARGDSEVHVACAMVGSGADEEAGMSLRSLRKSKVVARLRELCGL